MNIDSLNILSTKKTTKDMIISILSDEFPLTLKKINNRLLYKYQKNISYQGLYKELNSLIEDKVLIKNEKEYLLNKDWILSIQKFSKDIYLNYTEKKQYSLSIFDKLKNDGDAITLNFSSIKELDDFFVGVMENFNHILHPREKIYMYYRHNWWPILYSSKQNDILKKNENKRFYCVCGGNTHLDKWSTNYENKIGMHVKNIKNYNKHYEYQVYSDIVIQFYIDIKIERNIDDYFQTVTKISDFDTKYFLDILSKSGNITVILIKNKQLSKLLKEEFNEIFKNEERKTNNI